MNFAEFLKQAREAKGWRLNRLAKEAGVDYSTVRRLEKGTAQPRRGVMNLLFDALEVPDEARAPWLNERWALPGPTAPGYLDRAFLFHSGQAWRMLRLRRRLSSREVADAVGVLPAQVSRWEGGVNVPSVQERKRLLQVLDASAKECALLEKSAYRFGGSSIWLPILAECEEKVADIEVYRYKAATEPVELQLFLLLDDLTRLATRDERAINLIARLYIIYAARLGLWGQSRARQEWAEAGLKLIKPGPDTMLTWTGLVFLKGYSLSEKSSRAWLTWLTEAQLSFGEELLKERSTLYREMATAALQLRHLQHADGLLTTAEELADAAASVNADDESAVRVAASIRARFHMARGKPDKALELLAPPVVREKERLHVEGSFKHHLALAETCHAAGERGRAQHHLGEFYRIINTYHLEHERWRGEQLERQMQPTWAAKGGT